MLVRFKKTAGGARLAAAASASAATSLAGLKPLRYVGRHHAEPLPPPPGSSVVAAAAAGNVVPDDAVVLFSIPDGGASVEETIAQLQQHPGRHFRRSLTLNGACSPSPAGSYGIFLFNFLLNRIPPAPLCRHRHRRAQFHQAPQQRGGRLGHRRRRRHRRWHVLSRCQRYGRRRRRRRRWRCQLPLRRRSPPGGSRPACLRPAQRFFLQRSTHAVAPQPGAGARGLARIHRLQPGGSGAVPGALRCRGPRSRCQPSALLAGRHASTAASVSHGVHTHLPHPHRRSPALPLSLAEVQVRVCVIDTGARGDHEDLQQGRLVKGWNRACPTCAEGRWTGDMPAPGTPAYFNFSGAASAGRQARAPCRLLDARWQAPQDWFRAVMDGWQRVGLHATPPACLPASHPCRLALLCLPQTTAGTAPTPLASSAPWPTTCWGWRGSPGT